MEIIKYLKYLGLFLLSLIGIALFISLISLLGINYNLIFKLTTILMAILIFILSSIASHKFKDKGYIIGLKLGIIWIILLIIINFFFFKSNFNLTRIIYYIILIISSILGGSFGKNIKLKK